MATPYRRTSSVSSLNLGPSRTLLHQLLEEINGAPTPASRKSSLTLSSSSTRCYSQSHSSSVWVGGSSFAQDARDKLRAADEAHQRRAAANSIDGTPEIQSPSLHIDTVEFDTPTAQSNEDQREPTPGVHSTPDAVGYPYDHMKYMMKGSPLPSTVGLSPAAEGHDDTPFHLQAPSIGSDASRPLSPVMFSDMDFDDWSGSALTESTVSPVEAPTSAATVYSAEGQGTSSDEETTYTCKRVNSPDEMTPEAPLKKRRTTTLSNIRTEGLSNLTIDGPSRCIGVGGDNLCVLRDEAFTERASELQMTFDRSGSNVLPELSSFRPNDAHPQESTAACSPIRTLARAVTSPVKPASPAIPDTPAWMRPLHLVDKGDKSIYMNVHDDGPIRHALCLYCFRRHGRFEKVRKRGYEACGRTEVLDSHFWEDETSLGESSEDSDSTAPTLTSS